MRCRIEVERWPRPPFPLTGQILGALLCELAGEQAGGLADLDHVTVRVSHVAADLGAAIDRWGHELGPLRAPPLITRLDICDAQVQEARDRVPRLVVDDRDVGLVRGGTATWVHDQPRV